MAIPVLIIGKSGSGKSASMKSCVGKDFNVVRVLNKPLPFKGKINGWNSDDPVYPQGAQGRSGQVDCD